MVLDAEGYHRFHAVIKKEAALLPGSARTAALEDLRNRGPAAALRAAHVAKCVVVL